ncbi:unnamed protein product (macronuclear) [Paramecium tetraurelia]|uniref:Uncharacterized protein n=1 Tax=Paramecium tetraurelia TaxID=5888 RepID=A0DZE7_PARTE|nr:uncharacterized protein GSPATT00021581001 [Paramecium tetraurelia]CAK88414.1 unnamed protein product [Paramecium tetraurelia]|eukprot:XP_001455811.1 hypothetical protein (macronuclear) [Paramecium tetraurelia strain d4-2]
MIECSNVKHQKEYIYKFRLFNQGASQTHSNLHIFEGSNIHKEYQGTTNMDGHRESHSMKQNGFIFLIIDQSAC